MCSNLSICTLEHMHFGMLNIVSEWHNYAKNDFMLFKSLKSQTCLLASADNNRLHFYWIFCPKNTLCTQLKR